MATSLSLHSGWAPKGRHKIYDPVGTPWPKHTFHKGQDSHRLWLIASLPCDYYSQMMATHSVLEPFSYRTKEQLLLGHCWEAVTSHPFLSLELTDLISCYHLPLPRLTYHSLSSGPSGSLATQPVAGVAARQSAGAAFGLKIEEPMVSERKPVSRSMQHVFINPCSRFPSPSPFTITLPTNHFRSAGGDLSAVWTQSAPYRPRVWGELTHTRMFRFPRCGLNMQWHHAKRNHRTQNVGRTLAKLPLKIPNCVWNMLWRIVAVWGRTCMQTFFTPARTLKMVLGLKVTFPPVIFQKPSRGGAPELAPFCSRSVFPLTVNLSSPLLLARVSGWISANHIETVLTVTHAVQIK